MKAFNTEDGKMSTWELSKDAKLLEGYCWTSSWKKKGRIYGQKEEDDDNPENFHEFRRRNWRHMMMIRVYECNCHLAMKFQEIRQHGDHVNPNWTRYPLDITFIASEWMHGAMILNSSQRKVLS